jgi:hypothetical protein
VRARNSGAAPSGPAGCPPGYQRRADHQQRVLPDRWVHPTKSGKRITDCADDELTCGTGAADVCPAARPAPEPRQTQHRGTVIRRRRTPATYPRARRRAQPVGEPSGQRDCRDPRSDLPHGMSAHGPAPATTSPGCAATASSFASRAATCTASPLTAKHSRSSTPPRIRAFTASARQRRRLGRPARPAPRQRPTLGKGPQSEHANQWWPE